MSQLQDESVRRVSCDIAERLIERVKPEALQRFGMKEITRHALPRSLDEVYLGPVDEALEIASHILQSVVHAIRTRGEDINKAPTLEEIVAIVLDGVSSRLGEVGSKVEAREVAKGLETTFTEHPSLLDRIASAVLHPFEMEEDQLQQLERRLKQCVLKVVDHGPNQDWVGTAFALCERGHILTAAHILGEGHPLTISFQNESVRVDKWRDLVTSGYLNKEKDIAILKLDPQHWNQLRNAGLEPLRPEGTPPVLAVRDVNTMRRDPVLCLGYQTPLIQGSARFVGPAPAEARVATHYPIRQIEFIEDGYVQECLVLVIAEGDERIVRGMSGGPILNLRTGEVIAMITGAERIGRIRQPFKNRKEDLPLAEYGFGVLLSDIAGSWPEFKKCCLTQSVIRRC